jgi:PmbA protein
VVAQARGGESVEVLVGRSVDTEIRAYEGEVEAFTSATSMGAGIRVIRDGKQGFAYAGTLDAAVLSETLNEARDNASFSTNDPCNGLAVADSFPYCGIELYDESIAALPTERKIEMLLEFERMVMNGDPRIVGTESVDYADSIESVAIASTSGIRVAGRESSCSLIAYSLAAQGDEMTTGFGFSVGRAISELDAETAARDAVARAVEMLGAGSVPSDRLTVVFDPWVTAQFLGIVAEAFSGSEVLKGRSFLADRVGERIAPEGFTLFDDPTDPMWLGASVFDAEGLATRRNAMVVDGVVAGFLHDTYSANALGAVGTGSAVRSGFASTPSAGAHSIVISPGSQTPAEILRSVSTGVYVTEVQGLHSGVNPVSGDFSTGIEGRVIRGGELAEPIREVTIASTLQRMLTDIVAIGSDLTVMPMEAAGLTLAIADVTLSGA